MTTQNHPAGGHDQSSHGGGGGGSLSSGSKARLDQAVRSSGATRAKSPNARRKKLDSALKKSGFKVGDKLVGKDNAVNFTDSSDGSKGHYLFSGGKLRIRSGHATENSSVDDVHTFNLGIVMNKTQMIDYLVANGCGCWTNEDRETLNEFDDAKLRALVDNAEQHAQLVTVNEAVKKGITVNGETVALELKDGTLNAADMGKVARKRFLKDLSDDELEEEVKNRKVKNDDHGDEDEDDDDLPPFLKKKKGKKAMNEAPTTDNAAQRLTPDEQAAIDYGKRKINEERGRLIERLVANQADDAKPKHRERLDKKTLNELEEMVLYLPTDNELHVDQSARDYSQPLYVGPGAPPVTNSHELQSAEPLFVVQEDYSQAAKALH